MQESLWRSFELIYHDPSSKFAGRSHFNLSEKNGLSTEQRMQYLKYYAELNRSFHNIEEHFLATPIVSEEEIEKIKTYLKDVPCPQVRQVIPLKYWRWKLERTNSSQVDRPYHLTGVGDDDADLTNALQWVLLDYEDYTWNELEVPTLIGRNRPLCLRSRVRLKDFENIFLDIESIIDEYWIWVNGKLICHHQGYEPTKIELTDSLNCNKDNLIAIRVEKKESENIGIAGKVNLVCTNKIFIEDLFVRTLQVKQREASVRVEVDLKNNLSQDFEGRANIELTKWFPKEGDSPIFSADLLVKIPAGKTQCIKKDCQIEDPDVWFPDSPNLYRVNITLYNGDNHPVDDYVDTTGIRTIEQKSGKIYLNGERFFAKSFGNDFGFPPSPDSHGHICPPDEWLIRDMLLCKKANANTMRIHPWGFTGHKGSYNEYGWPDWGDPSDATNYSRIAHIADQLGLCLHWTSRHWTLWFQGFRRNYDEDRMEDLLVPSIKKIRNHPSIIIYEGLNEVGGHGRIKRWDFTSRESTPLIEGLIDKEKKPLREYYIKSLDRFYQKYIRIINSVDNSKLICPDSSLNPFQYFQGSPELLDIFLAENVFWDVHDYVGWYTDFSQMYNYDNIYWPKDKKRPVMLNECGAEAMPNWSLYKGLPWYGVWLNNGRSCAEIEKARLGKSFNILQNSEVHLSQAFQGLCIQQTVNFLRTTGADGMNINLIADGLAEGCYHKGVTDLYRKGKIGYFVTKMCYQDILVTGMDGDFIFSKNDKLKLRLTTDKKLKEQKGTLRVIIKDMEGKIVDETSLDVKLSEVGVQQLREYRPNFPKQGFYQIEYIVEK